MTKIIETNPGPLSGKAVTLGLTITSKLPTACTSSETPTKEKLQKLIFPEGIYYNREKDALLTRRINLAFAPNPLLNCISEDDPNKQGSISAALSSLVDLAGQFSIALCKVREVGI